MQYRQITKGMRVSRPGLTTLESFRPIDDKTHEFTDIEQPTLIELDDTCDVNIEMLLATGAIVEYAPPRKVDPKLKELVDG